MGRGRKKGSLNSYKYENEDGEECIVKRYKLLGYCPECSGMIGTGDLQSKFIYVCPKCSDRNRTKYLLEEIEREKYNSKSEYLSSGMNAEYGDMPAMKDKPEKIEVAK